jgi:hypothetical protein
VSEFLKIFETAGGVTVEQLLAFAALVVPGFISLRVYDMRRGGEGRKINEALIDVVVYSFATDVIGFVALSLVRAIAGPAARPVASITVAMLTIMIVPAALALSSFDLQRRMIRSGLVVDTATNLLERILDRVARERLELGAIVTLRDGRKIGARIASPLASQVLDDEVLLGEVWTIDQERVTFLNAVNGSAGILISRADCQSIEPIRWSDVVFAGGPAREKSAT